MQAPCPPPPKKGTFLHNYDQYEMLKWSIVLFPVSHFLVLVMAPAAISVVDNLTSISCTEAQQLCKKDRSCSPLYKKMDRFCDRSGELHAESSTNSQYFLSLGWHHSILSSQPFNVKRRTDQSVKKFCRNYRPVLTSEAACVLRRTPLRSSVMTSRAEYSFTNVLPRTTVGIL